MSTTFVVAVDGSESGWKALDLAATLAKLWAAQLVLVHVVSFQPLSQDLEAWAEIEGLTARTLRGQVNYRRTLGDRIIAEGEALIGKKGFDQVTARVVDGNVAGEIVKVVEDTNADMLFVGSRGLSDLKGMLLGSVSHKLTHLAPCTCIVVK